MYTLFLTLFLLQGPTILLLFPGLQPELELSCLLQQNLREPFTVFNQSMASESFKYVDQSVDAPYTLLHTDNT